MLADLKQSLAIIMLAYIVPTLYQHLACWDLWHVLSADGSRDMDHINYRHPPSSRPANMKF